MQLPRANIVHEKIVVDIDGVDVIAVRTHWPLALKWRDFGAEAYDAVDGKLRVRILGTLLLEHAQDFLSTAL